MRLINKKIDVIKILEPGQSFDKMCRLKGIKPFSEMTLTSAVDAVIVLSRTTNAVPVSRLGPI